MADASGNYVAGKRRKGTNKWYVFFTDADGTNYVSSWTSVTNWSASGNKSEAMLFDYARALEIMEELKGHPRYQAGPENGFYRVNISQADEKLFSDWCGPSGELLNYLMEGNDKEDLVKVFWKMLTLDQRKQLEREAEDFKKFMEQHGEEEE